MKTTITALLFIGFCCLSCIFLYSCSDQTQTYKCPGFDTSKRGYLIHNATDEVLFTSLNGDKASLLFNSLFESQAYETNCKRGTFSTTYCDGCNQPFANLNGTIRINANTDSSITINNFRVQVSETKTATGNPTGFVYVGVNPVINREGFIYQVEPSFSLITERTQASLVSSITLNNKSFAQVILSKMDSMFFAVNSNIDSVYFSTKVGLVAFTTRTPRKLFVRQ